MAEEQRRNPGDTFDLRFASAFRAAMDKLPIPDTDTPARIVLHHTDLAPRNIFIDVQSGAITGVLDWGSGRKFASGSSMADACLALGQRG